MGTEERKAGRMLTFEGMRGKRYRIPQQKKKKENIQLSEQQNELIVIALLKNFKELKNQLYIKSMGTDPGKLNRSSQRDRVVYNNFFSSFG